MRRAFTLIEMMVVISILLLLSAWVAPNLVAIERSRALREREAALLRLPAEAREEALRSKAPVALRIESAQIVLERTPADQEPQEIKRVSLGNELSVRSVRQRGETQSPDGWQWVVYPDGSSVEASLDLSEGSSERTLVLPARGEARWESADDDAEDEETDWPAGEIAARG